MVETRIRNTVSLVTVPESVDLSGKGRVRRRKSVQVIKTYYETSTVKRWVLMTQNAYEWMNIHLEEKGGNGPGNSG